MRGEALAIGHVEPNRRSKQIFSHGLQYFGPNEVVDDSEISIFLRQLGYLLQGSLETNSRGMIQLGRET